jgi:hypothetical protein
MTVSFRWTGANSPKVHLHPFEDATKTPDSYSPLSQLAGVAWPPGALLAVLLLSVPSAALTSLFMRVYEAWNTHPYSIMAS